MRLWPSAFALAALALLQAARHSQAGPQGPAPSTLAGPELVLLWPEPDRDDPEAPWPGAFAVANRGGTASGPVRLIVRTPVGVAHTADLAPDLLPGTSTSNGLVLHLEPGMTELCLEVRATPASPARAELDLTDNRVCRRPHRAGRLGDAIRQPFQEALR